MNRDGRRLVAGAASMFILGAQLTLAQAQDADRAAMEARLLAAVATQGQGLGQGAEQVGTVRVAALRQGQARTYPATFAANRCYAVLAASEDTLQNVDVSIERGRAVLARDTEAATHAEARHCTANAVERVTLRVRAYHGAGRAALVLYTVPAGAPTLAPVATTATSGALERLAELTQVAAGDFAQVSPPMRDQGTRGQRVIKPIVLTPGRCYRVLAASEDAVEDLGLEVIGPNGASIVRDTSEGRQPSLGVLAPFCPANPGTYQIVATVVRGAGAFAIQVFGSGGGAAAPSAGAPTTPRFRAGGTGSDFIAARLRSTAGGLAGATVESDVTRGTLQTSASQEVRFEVVAGRCYVVAGAAVPSMRELDVQVVDAYGNEMARDATHDAFPTARACPQVAGTWRATVRAFAGYGAFGAQVFSVPR